MELMKRIDTTPASDRSSWALLLIDVINDFAFPEARQLLGFAATAAKRLATLKSRAKRRGVPVIYVNDNFGRWQSDFRRQVDRCMDETCLGAPIAKLLLPQNDDYFVLKPKHSAFYSTTLDVLLDHLGTRKLVMGGFATDICILFTANDAYMRDYKLYIPSDCCAAETAKAHRNACAHMRSVLGADTRPSRNLRISAG